MTNPNPKKYKYYKINHLLLEINGLLKECKTLESIGCYKTKLKVINAKYKYIRNFLEIMDMAPKNKKG